MSTRTSARSGLFLVVFALAVAFAAISATPALAREPFNAKVIRKVARQHRLPAADVRALIILARRESGYSARCITGSYKGLFQLKTRDRRWADPEWNTKVAIKNIKIRYKTPRRALAHSYAYGWY